MSLFEKLLAGEVKPGSALNIRNEQKQKRNFSKSIQKLKREKGKVSKLLIFKELAFPFDAMTGSKEQFNEDFKWRYATGQKDVILAIKRAANENEDLKKLYMAKARRASWDTSNLDVVTEEDMSIFRVHTVIQTFTYPVVNINVPLFTPGDYGQDFLIDIKRDELTGAIVGDVPTPLVVRKFFSDMAYEEVQALKKSNADSPNPMTDKDLKEKVKAIYQKNPISDEKRRNFYLAVELPLTAKSKFPDGFSLEGTTLEDIGAKLVRIPKNDDIVKAMTDLFDGTREEQDRFCDYWEVDMKCPAEAADNLELANNTAYNIVPVQYIDKVKGYADFEKAVADYRESTADEIDKIMSASVRLRKLSAEDNDNLIEASGRLINTESEYLTVKVIKSNANFLTMALGDKGDALLVKAELDMAPEGELDEMKAFSEYKENVSSILNEIDDSEDDDDLED